MDAETQHQNGFLAQTATIRSYERLRHYPYFLQTPVRWVLERLSRVSVIMQFQDKITDRKLAHGKQ